MSVRPPPPPRRVPPPLPPPRGSNTTETTNAPVGIAARIANLQLDQVGRNALGRPPVKARSQAPETVLDDVQKINPAAENKYTPPPIPPRSTRPKLPPALQDPVQRAKALSRPPPPPPTPSRAVPPVPNGFTRRLPPMPTRLPTPPQPQPEEELYEPEEHTDSQMDEIYEQSTGEIYAHEDSCIKCRDFSHVDAHAALFPRHTITSLDNLAYDLTEPFPNETDKARAIFTWLHHNIVYDTASFFSGNLRASTPDSTLQSGLAVCEGYAGLFKSLADRVGLQAMTVSGHGKGFGYIPLGPDVPVPTIESNHAWNCVVMDGEWHLIDTCWGAGYVDGSTYSQRFAPNWFTSTPTEFGRRHYPTDPGYQLISDDEGGPVSWKDYILAPEGPVFFGDLDKLNYLPDLVQPSTKCIEGKRRVSFHIWKRCEHMSTDEADNYVLFIASDNDRERTPMELNAEGGWSATVYIPQGGDVSLYYVTQVDGRDAKGLGVQGFRKANGRKAMSFGGICRWTVI